MLFRALLVLKRFTLQQINYFFTLVIQNDTEILSFRQIMNLNYFFIRNGLALS
jgi:hypothetical protein